MPTPDSASTDIRGDLEAAVDAEVAADAAVDQIIEKAAPEADSPQERPRGEPEEAPAKEPAEEKPARTAPISKEEPAEKEKKVPPPRSWKPFAREKWDSAPPEIKQEAIRREKEITQALQESSEARQSYQKLREIWSPHESRFRAMGASDPIQAFNFLAQSEAVLALGSQAQKAQAIANFVKTYGVDVRELDNALAQALGISQGTNGPVASSSPIGGPVRDPRLDALLGQIEQAKAQRDQQVSSAALDEIAAVENEEFFEDVRMDMADILDARANRGLHTTAEEAYNLAIRLNPDVARIIEQREEAERNRPSTARAREASSSIRPNPALREDAGQPGVNLTDDLYEAWEKVQGSRGR